MTNYTGSWNWDTKSQGVLFDGNDTQAVTQYRAQAVERTESYAQLLQELRDTLGFKIEIIGPDIKTEESSLRKVWDRNAKNAYGQPENIIDYLRATIIVPEGTNGIKNLRQTMETLISHPLTVAYKDQFWKPEPGTGYRSFKALLNINGHTAELKVDYEGMEAANDVTESLRNFERQLKTAEQVAPDRCSKKFETFDDGVRKLTTKMEVMIATIRELRLQCHDFYATKCGIDELLDPNANRQSSLTTDFAKSVKDAIRTHALGRGLVSLLNKLSPEPEQRPLRPT